MVALSPVEFEGLERVNASANGEIDCSISDQELYGLEEYWAIPSDGAGDCEDIALYKREALVKAGLPRGAMTLAIVHHRKDLFSHAVLLIETGQGTFLLDSYSDEVKLWHEAPYNFESRERPDGRWDRYDQQAWRWD